MPGPKREAERVYPPGPITGEVTVYEPMTILDLSDRGALVATQLARHQRHVEREHALEPVPVLVRAQQRHETAKRVAEHQRRCGRIEQTVTKFALHVDSLHEFRLSLGTRSVIVKGRIVHCQIGDLQEGVVLYRSGIEFVEPSEHATSAIHAFVEAQKFAAHAPPPIVEAELADENGG